MAIIYFWNRLGRMNQLKSCLSIWLIAERNRRTCVQMYHFRHINIWNNRWHMSRTSFCTQTNAKDIVVGRARSWKCLFSYSYKWSQIARLPYVYSLITPNTHNYVVSTYGSHAELKISIFNGRYHVWLYSQIKFIPIWTCPCISTVGDFRAKQEESKYFFFRLYPIYGI